MNDTTRGALEAAAGLCLARTHYDIEVEHFLMKLLDTLGYGFCAHPETFERGQVAPPAELTRSLDKLKTGNARTPALSPRWSRC